MRANKRSSKIALCYFSFICAFFSFTNYSTAQSDRLDTPVNGNAVVKIPPPQEGIPQSNRKAQVLDVEKIFILSANGRKHNFDVEMAITYDEQRIGMMYRDHVDEGTGMLFLFDEEIERNFWMKDTLIPLDILFIRRDGIIHHIHSMAEEQSLKRISSEGPVKAVLEVAGGETEVLGIKVGDRVMHKVFLPEGLQ